MIRVDRLRINYQEVKKDARYRIAEEGSPVFSWSVSSTQSGDAQTACRVCVHGETGLLWDSGWVAQKEQSLTYSGAPLPCEERLCVSVAVRGKAEESLPLEEYFYQSGLSGCALNWIAPREDRKGSVLYFKKELELTEPAERVVAYVSGIGCHRFAVNGADADESLMDPPVSDYTKRVYAVMYPELASLLHEGRNVLTVAVGEGWRRNEGEYLNAIGDRTVDFFGRPQLAVCLHIRYRSGREESVETDESWLAGHGAITKSNLFQGEEYDASVMEQGWDQPGIHPAGFTNAVRVPAPGGTECSAVLAPVRQMEQYRPKAILPTNENTVLVDFGQNIAGAVRLHLPEPLQKGTRITVRYSEEVELDGRLSLATMRKAESLDTYIASGDERDLSQWQPGFTYHGFRYVEVSGLPLLKKEDIVGVSFYNDIAADSWFSCGSAVANAIHHMAVQTEKANLHNLLTDCPQRDERMGWMNDATVRFEGTPYSFDIGGIFPKIVADLADTQDADGAITCTAPRIYGERPADPVCSSFLIAARQAYRFTGNLQILKEYYPCFVQWQKCLTDHSEGHIVQYSHYGDWAAPVYACVGGDSDIDAVQNRYTPGIFMSTGYYYLNACLLAEFADILGLPDDRMHWLQLAEQIKTAMLAKWWEPESGRIAVGSQGCQSFALWLGILPEEQRALAAKVLHDDLLARDYRFTTGNLCTRYLFDVLAEYGYIDDAWKLLTREAYPSFGYMLQNEATTVWERFECKREIAMNSHCHPMYGSVDYWLYAYIAGIRFAGKDCEQAVIQPYFPADLLSASAQVETVLGRLHVRWIRQFGELALFVTVPFGMTADVVFDGKTETVGSGFHCFRKPL